MNTLFITYKSSFHRCNTFLLESIMVMAFFTYHCQPYKAQTQQRIKHQSRIRVVHQRRYLWQWGHGKANGKSIVLGPDVELHLECFLCSTYTLLHSNIELWTAILIRWQLQIHLMTTNVIWILLKMNIPTIKNRLRYFGLKTDAKPYVYQRDKVSNCSSTNKLWSAQSWNIMLKSFQHNGRFGKDRIF